MASFGKTILNYGDYVVRASDLALIEGPNWLNDVLIGFYMEYLAEEVHTGPGPKLRFVGPEITQCVKLSGPEDTINLLGPLEEFDFVFWVLNNSEDPTELSGGTHWSLLVYSRPENLIAHYDSSNGSNNNSADILFRVLSRVITPRPIFQSRGTVTQQNGYDCGFHVLCNLEIIADYVAKARCLNGIHTAKPQQAQNMRSRLLQLITKKVTEASSLTPKT